MSSEPSGAKWSAPAQWRPPSTTAASRMTHLITRLMTTRRRNQRRKARSRHHLLQASRAHALAALGRALGPLSAGLGRSEHTAAACGAIWGACTPNAHQHVSTVSCQPHGTVRAQLQVPLQLVWAELMSWLWLVCTRMCQLFAVSRMAQPSVWSSLS